MSFSERGERNEIEYRNVDEEAEHAEQGDRPAPPDPERDRSDSADTPPAAPADDDAPLGDTDQHSDADA